MTALDMIREGLGIWVDGSLRGNAPSTPIVFTLLFLFGFLSAALTRSFGRPHRTRIIRPELLPVEGREIIDAANTARLFELESELASKEDALKRLTETLSTTFAHLSSGLAVFDADKSLFLFNPALSGLLDLDPVWLANRPTIADFLAKLRENRHLPEKKEFLEWRRLLTGLKDTVAQKIYEEEWTLPDGRIFYVTGRPHPRGAIAFLFEDISERVAAEREHRREIEFNRGILDGVSEKIVVFDRAGRVRFVNAQVKPRSGLEHLSVIAAWGGGTPSDGDAEDFGNALQSYIVDQNHTKPWTRVIDGASEETVVARASKLSDGSTLVGFSATARAEVKQPAAGIIQDETDVLRIGKLARMLGQRGISLDHSGFGPSFTDAPDIRRVIWSLTIAAANNCRAGGTVYLTSYVDGPHFSLSCSVPRVDQLPELQENVAATFLKSVFTRADARGAWDYDETAAPLTVTFKRHHPIALSAV